MSGANLFQHGHQSQQLQDDGNGMYSILDIEVADMEKGKALSMRIMWLGDTKVETASNTTSSTYLHIALS
jgi:hypothetical protein